jgi:hypothetical protein
MLQYAPGTSKESKNFVGIYMKSIMRCTQKFISRIFIPTSYISQTRSEKQGTTQSNSPDKYFPFYGSRVEEPSLFQSIQGVGAQ